MSNIQILKPGVFTTVQDRGRSNYQCFGMPIGGCMDWYAAELANRLVGNEASAACIEITYTGPMIQLDSNSSFAITGAHLSPMLNDEPVEMNRTYFAKAGDVLRFGELVEGCRGYLAFAGGVSVPEVLGSRSTYIPAKMGGHEGRKLKAGDILKLGESASRQLPQFEFQPYHYDQQEVRVVAGPEANCFPPHSISQFLISPYKILPESDRMAYRLSGEPLPMKNSHPMISSATALGTIQVPSDGQPIVLMADRQTTGGYPRITNVISADIPLLAQKKAGDTIGFREVKLDEAQQILNELKRGLYVLSE